MAVPGDLAALRGQAAQAEPLVPAYGRGSLADLVPALRAPRDQRPAWLPEPARRLERSVLVVLDGLGWHQLRRSAHLAPVLGAMQGGPITSVAPTTTAVALTSITTGTPPATHGMVGYRVLVEGSEGQPEVMNTLRWRTPSGDARGFVDPAGFVTVDPFGGDPVPVVSRLAFDGTGFTTAHQRGAELHGYAVTSTIAVALRRLAGAGCPFAYAYYEGVDTVAHLTGFGDEYDAEVAFVDRLVGELLEALPPDVALVVTADHGQVEVGERTEVIDDAVLAETAQVSGEARFRWFHAHPGRDRALAEVVADRYGARAWVRTVDEVEEAGWLGGNLDARVRARLGDVALVASEPVAYLAPGDSDARLVCRHGSLTADEVLVPLLAAPGRR